MPCFPFEDPGQIVSVYIERSSDPGQGEFLFTVLPDKISRLLTALASEYEMKLTLGPATYLVSIVLTFGVSLTVGLMVAKKNKHIDMVAALKTEE